MNITKIVFPPLLISLIVGFVVISPVKAQVPPPSPVVIAKVEEQKVQRPITLVGNSEPSKRSLIASEISGLVESFPVKEGDYIKKGDVLAIFETEPLEIRLREAKASKREAQARYELAQKNYQRFQELKNKGIASIQQLQDMESEQKAWSAKTSQLQAQIDRYEYDLDKATRTFPVKIVINNKDHIIKSGMVARVSFLIGEPSLVKLVPKDAIVERNNLKFVIVVNNGTAQPVPVNTGVAYKNLIEIIGPINIGQPVVIRGNERLQPGQPVKVVNQDGMPEKK